MELAGYRCWEPRRVFTVMNPDAEHVSDEQFLAVHTDYPLTLIDPNMANRDAEASRYHLTSAQFLEQFLTPNRHHVQAVVMGWSGSGKSHFIKWLSLNIPRRADRRVLVIPKAGMSLRRIVERLIDELPPTKRDRYQERLGAIGYEAANRSLMLSQLCNSIAVALEGSEVENDMEQWLVDELPKLFYDPALRPLLKDRHGVIEDLVDHIFQGQAGYQRIESQRLFREEDLPLQPKQISALSSPTQSVVRLLQGDAELVQAALHLINRNLSKAISQCLNFTGDQLIELMLDVRRGLKAEGQSLILLIEDFARLQGIDGALLQALIESASEENGLCELRWAMAVTRGYYEQRVPATVQTRMQFVIDMDVPTGHADGVTAEKVVAFAARYLNAVRVSDADLVSWRQANLNGDHSLALPNRCTDCPIRVVCHQTFGEVDGFGLYPFSGNAVLNMTRRMDAHFDRRFNPRIVVKDVLGEILGNYGDEIEAGTFPSKSLLQRMGGSKLPPAVDEKLRTDNPVQADRRLALLSLWSRRPDQLESLPEGIYEAFRLTTPGLTGMPLASDDEDQDSITDDQVGRKPKSAIDQLVEAVQAWGRGETMQDKVLNALRPQLKTALFAYMDWDQIGIKPSAVEFEPRSIGFVGQMTRFTPPAKGPRLQLPLDADSEDARRHAAMALEGLLRYGEHGQWSFPDGALMLAAYAEAVESWAAHLVAQIQEPPGGATWEPVVAAVELLTLSNAMTGLPSTKDATLVDWVDALFLPGRAPDESLVSEWHSLAEALRDSRSALQDIVRDRASGTKGAKRGAFIDPTLICESVRRVRRTWEAAEKIPLAEVEGRGGAFKTLARVRKRVDKELVTAVQREAERRRELVTVVSAALPDGSSWKESVADLRNLVDQVSNVAVSRSQALHTQLRELLATSEKLAVEDALKEVTALDEKARTNLAILGRTKTSAVLQQAGGLVRVAFRYLDDLEAGIAKDLSGLGEDGDLLDRSKETIAESLDTLTATLKELGGEGDA